jgi:hypothetical protein
MPVNRDIILIYREVWKMTERFTWCDEDGNSWRDILRTTARREFEQMRTETDSVKIGKQMITWRETIANIHEKVNKA